MTRNNFIKALLLLPFVSHLKENKPTGRLTIRNRHEGETTVVAKGELPDGTWRPVYVYYSCHNMSVKPGTYKFRK